MTEHEARINLRKVLANLYPDKSDAQRVAQDAGLELQFIAFSGKAINIWNSILNEAENRNLVHNLAQIVRNDYGSNPKLDKALTDYVNLLHISQTPKKRNTVPSSFILIGFVLLVIVLWWLIPKADSFFQKQQAAIIGLPRATATSSWITPKNTTFTEPPIILPVPQQIQWLPELGQFGVPGICVGWTEGMGQTCPEPHTFIAFTDFTVEFENEVRQKANLPSDSLLKLRNANGNVDVHTTSDEWIANVLIGNDPLNNNKYDGLIRIEKLSPPGQPIMVFQRYSDGSYLLR